MWNRIANWALYTENAVKLWDVFDWLVLIRAYGYPS